MKLYGKKEETGYSIIYASANTKVNDVKPILGKCEPSDAKFLKDMGDHYIVCAKLKSKWIAEQLKSN